MSELRFIDQNVVSIKVVRETKNDNYW